MKRGSEQYGAARERGDTVRELQLTGHRVVLLAGPATPTRLPRWGPRRSSRGSGSSATGAPALGRGFTLIELVISITVLTILTLGVVPLVKLSVKRQREQELHEALRGMRAAIDEFHRDTAGMERLCTGTVTGGAPPPLPLDPRSKVVISDCTIFGVDNPDRYPPDLQTLVDGVSVVPRVPPVANPNTPATQVNQLSTKKKVYLRALPVDPMTGTKEWDLRSCYDPADSDSWGGENLFDVRSKSKDTALNGEKYRDW